jgi:hypothetical protein
VVRSIQTQSRVLLVLFAVAALALAGCSGSSKLAPPAATGAANPAATDAGNGNGGGTGLSGAAGAFSSINNYKFSMTLAGGTWGSTLSALGGKAGDKGFTISGVVVVKPEEASDVTMSGFHIIEVGGFQYMDMGTGSYIKTASTGSSMASAFSPSKMFSNYVGGSAEGYNKVGSENKNGVDTDHYQASASALAGYSSLAGVADATWTVDTWVAKNGGYPVSLAMVATASDNSIAFQILFDVTNVNDPANTVTAPTNVTGS